MSECASTSRRDPRHNQVCRFTSGSGRRRQMWFGHRPIGGVACIAQHIAPMLGSRDFGLGHEVFPFVFANSRESQLLSHAVRVPPASDRQERKCHPIKLGNSHSMAVVLPPAPACHWWRSRLWAVACHRAPNLRNYPFLGSSLLLSGTADYRGCLWTGRIILSTQIGCSEGPAL